MLGFCCVFLLHEMEKTKISSSMAQTKDKQIILLRESHPTSTLYNTIRSPVPVFLLALVLGSVHALFSLDAAWLNVSAKGQKMSL